jgi:hypothetical protein
MGQTTDYPALESRHLADARLYAERKEMLAACTHARGGVIAEVGVAHGEFSQHILDALAPRRFHAIDIFRMHHEPSHWGIPSEVMFKGMTHRAFYEDRFARHGGVVVTHECFSHEGLALLDDASLDLIYLDADHGYEAVRRDAQVALAKIKPDGTLIFNDYTMFDPFQNSAYGVVQVVNELVVNGGWFVTGFALQRHMFCDIALRKVPAARGLRRLFGG